MAAVSDGRYEFSTAHALLQVGGHILDNVGDLWGLHRHRGNHRRASRRFYPILIWTKALDCSRVDGAEGRILHVPAEFP